MYLVYNNKLDIQHNISNIVAENSYKSNYFLDMSLLCIFILMVSIFTCKQICNFYKSSNNQCDNNEFNDTESIENNLEERFLSNTTANEILDISYNDIESVHDKEIDYELPSYSEIKN